MHDDFKKISNLIKLFVVLFDGVSHNVQLFHDAHVQLVEKVVELEKVLSDVGTVSLSEVDKVRDELFLVQNVKFVLESNVAGYDDVVEEVSTLKVTVESLELEKTRLVDKIAMLEHVVRKSKIDLNDSTLWNTDLQASVVRLES